MEHEIPWVSLSPNMTKETEGLFTRGLTSHSAPALYLIKHNSFYSGPAGNKHLTRSNSTMHKLHVLMYVLITCENCRCNLKPSAERMCIKSPTTKTQKTEINQRRQTKQSTLIMDIFTIEPQVRFLWLSHDTCMDLSQRGHGIVVTIASTAGVRQKVWKWWLVVYVINQAWQWQSPQQFSRCDCCQA